MNEETKKEISLMQAEIDDLKESVEEITFQDRIKNIENRLDIIEQSLEMAGLRI